MKMNRATWFMILFFFGFVVGYLLNHPPPHYNNLVEEEYKIPHGCDLNSASNHNITFNCILVINPVDVIR